MNFALIPYTVDKYKDKYFYEVDKQGEKEFVSDDIREFWQYFVDLGDEIHTIDYYADSLERADFILIFNVDWKWISRIVREGYADRMVYCNAEPPTVLRLNSPKGFKILEEIFPYILTWNRDWIDGRRIFLRNIPYNFEYHFGNVSYENRKLLTAITANKKSHYKYELYSERERAYAFFEKELPNDFTFYGVGWNQENHPGYGGCVNSKFETYHQYRFALCLENTRNVKDYVTEKIFDCLCSGIVPIYGGASNIHEIVPENCYIDYFSFDSLEAMKNFILNIDKNRYQSYLNAAQKFIESDVKIKYTRKQYAEYIYKAIKTHNDFKISVHGRGIVEFMKLKQVMNSIL